MKMQIRIGLVATGLAGLIVPSSAQLEAPPALIDYQGQLLNSIGGPLTGAGGPGTMGTAANFEIRFRIWDAQTSGNLIWAESQIVTVDGNGFFSVRLGEGEAITVADGDPNPLSGSIPNSGTALHAVFDENERFLGVTVMQPPNTPGEISPRLRFLTAPYSVAAEKARYAEFGPTTGPFLVDSLGVGTTSPNSALHVSSPLSVNLLLEADSDNLGDNDHPTLTFSQDGGAQQTSLGYFNGTDDFGVGINGTRWLTIQPDGDIGAGTTTPGEDFHLVRPNTDQARFYATGTGTGGGMYYAGQDANFGGGFFYEGDATPSVPGDPDRTVFFRRSNGSDVEVMSYAWNSNNVYFTGNIGLGTSSPSNRLTLGSGSVDLDDGSVLLPAGDSQGIFWSYPFALITYMRLYHDSNNRFWAVNGTNGMFINSGGTSWVPNSDERLKSEIDPIDDILTKIRDIRVVSYNMAARTVDPQTGEVSIDRNPPPRKTKSGKVIKQEIGTIAQDWIKDFPELVSEPVDERDYYGLSYDRLGVVAIGAAQELDRKLRDTEAKLAASDAKIADLESRLARLEKLMSAAK